MKNKVIVILFILFSCISCQSKQLDDSTKDDNDKNNDKIVETEKADDENNNINKDVTNNQKEDDKETTTKASNKKTNKPTSQTKSTTTTTSKTKTQNSMDFAKTLGTDKVILSSSQISSYNNSIKTKSGMAYDVYNISTISKDKVLAYINSYKLPSLPKYNGNTVLTKQNTQTILDNRNLDNIKQQINVVRGIIVKRTNLKSFPTDIHFYDRKGANNFDNIQESELHVNTPVLVVHESKDGKWNFVISPFYVGWIKKDNVAIASSDDFTYFTKNSSFVVITDVKVSVSGVSLDMSVRLPYVGNSANGYRVILPKKGSDGYVKKEEITVAKNKAHVGFLAYTKRNVYLQALKYKGIKYSWGGMNDGVDCSSYVANVYRTFGFMFPRNTSNQNKSVGTIISLKNKTPKQKLETIKNKYPSLLYQSGHVMLYLGVLNNKHYIIHANGTDMKVALTVLNENSSYLKAIDRVVTIP